MNKDKHTNKTLESIPEIGKRLLEATVMFKTNNCIAKIEIPLFASCVATTEMFK